MWPKGQKNHYYLKISQRNIDLTIHTQTYIPRLESHTQWGCKVSLQRYLRIGGGGLVPKSCLTLEPGRLLCPWDSPGKNNGVGCHCFLQNSSITVNKIESVIWNLQKRKIQASKLSLVNSTKLQLNTNCFRNLRKHSPIHFIRLALLSH